MLYLKSYSVLHLPKIRLINFGKFKICSRWDFRLNRFSVEGLGQKWIQLILLCAYSKFRKFIYQTLIYYSESSNVQEVCLVERSYDARDRDLSMVVLEIFTGFIFDSLELEILKSHSGRCRGKGFCKYSSYTGFVHKNSYFQFMLLLSTECPSFGQKIDVCKLNRL